MQEYTRMDQDGGCRLKRRGCWGGSLGQGGNSQIWEEVSREGWLSSISRQWIEGGIHWGGIPQGRSGLWGSREGKDQWYDDKWLPYCGWNQHVVIVVRQMLRNRGDCIIFPVFSKISERPQWHIHRFQSSAIKLKVYLKFNGRILISKDKI